jgi:hypothetical protein
MQMLSVGERRVNSGADSLGRGVLISYLKEKA